MGGTSIPTPGCQTRRGRTCKSVIEGHESLQHENQNWEGFSPTGWSLQYKQNGPIPGLSPGKRKWMFATPQGPLLLRQCASTGGNFLANGVRYENYLLAQGNPGNSGGGWIKD